SAGGAGLVSGSARGYLLEGDLGPDQVERLMAELLVDPLVETGRAQELGAAQDGPASVTVLLRPGVMDPAALSVTDAARDLGLPVRSVRTFRRYFGPLAAAGQAPPELRTAREVMFRKVLANEAIEQVVPGPVSAAHLHLGTPYNFRLVTVPLRDLDDAGLGRL